MKEQDFIKIIKNTVKNSYIGDDCASLKELGIVVTQDNFVEDIHFKRDWATPFQIGYKAAAVNVSDILASGAEPRYLTVGLSLPNDIDDNFVSELYRGLKVGSYGAEIIGGDITGSKSIFISIAAIGHTKGRFISSRSNAKPGYAVIANNLKFGISSQGLIELQKGVKASNAIKTHLEPILDLSFSKKIATNVNTDYAMMDTSDGLADALYNIAVASNVTIIAKEIEGMFGAEDYNLVAAVPRELLNCFSEPYIIGEVLEPSEYYLIVGDKKFKNYNELGLYDHFGERYE